MAVMLFVTQFTHISRHFGVHNRKQKKMIKKKLFWKYGLRFEDIIAYVSTKLLLEKSAKTIKKKIKKNKKKNMKIFTIFGGFWGPN